MGGEKVLSIAWEMSYGVSTSMTKNGEKIEFLGNILTDHDFMHDGQHTQLLWPEIYAYICFMDNASSQRKVTSLAEMKLAN
jgi:hypothetical protein